MSIAINTSYFGHDISKVSVNSTDVLAPSKAILLFTIVGFVIFSILGLISSAITVIVIVFSKPMHTNCFKLIAGGGVGSFVVAAHYLSRGIDKIGLELGAFRFERTGLQCLLLTGIFGIWGIVFHGQLTCAVAFDRLLSVTVPHRYRHFGKRYVLCIFIFCALFDTVKEIVGFVTAPLSEDLICTEFMDALNPLFVHTYALMSLSYCTLNVLVYAALLLCMRLRQKFLSDSVSNNDKFMKQQLAVMPTVKLMILLYLVTGVLAEVLVNIGLNIPLGDQAFLLISAGTILKDASSLVEGFSLMVRCPKFRKCFKKLVRSPNVHPENSSRALSLTTRAPLQTHG